MNCKTYDFEYSVLDKTYKKEIEIDLEEYKEAIAEEAVHLNNYGPVVREPILHRAKLEFIINKINEIINKDIPVKISMIDETQIAEELIPEIDGDLKEYLEEMQSNISDDL